VNALAARLIEESGFDEVNVSGAVIAAEHGLQEIGLTMLSEVIDQSGTVASVTDRPTLRDTDTGFGEPLNIVRTIETFEHARLR
jgi:methylisocitrate lyase